MSDINLSSITAGLAWLEKMAPKRPIPSAGYVCEYGTVRGPVVQGSRYRACHSSLSNGDNIGSDAVVNCSMVKDRSELTDRFYKWFHERSFASRFIHSPGWEYTGKYGCLITSDMPSNALLSVAVMMRCPTEKPHQATLMFEYVDKFSLPEDLAYLLAVREARGWHNNVFATDVEYVRNFLRHDFKHVRPDYRLNTNYGAFTDTGILTLFGRDKNNGKGLYDDLKKHIRQAETNQTVVPNPFKPVASSFGAPTMTEDQLREILPDIKELFKNDAPNARDPRTSTEDLRTAANG